MNNQVVINKENIMNKELKISAENALVAYNNTDANGRELLEHLFGKDIFKPKDIRDRIKTFDDAVHKLGDKHKLVREYKHIIVYNCMSNDIIAYAKLRIIAEALNEGWKPTYKKDEPRYYPYFIRYNQSEYAELDNYFKEQFTEIGSKYPSFTEHKDIKYVKFGYVANTPLHCISYQLVLKTRELAEYCGKQFIDIWSDFLFT